MGLELREVADAVLGTCNPLDEYAEAIGMDVEELQEILESEYGLKMCSDCAWWCELFEFIDDNGEEHDECEDCR